MVHGKEQVVLVVLVAEERAVEGFPLDRPGRPTQAAAVVAAAVLVPVVPVQTVAVQAVPALSLFAMPILMET